MAWAIVWPPLSFNADYVMWVVVVLGTTITPYLFFWQAGGGHQRGACARPLIRAPEQADAESARIRIDTFIGMGYPILSPCSLSSPRRRR
jgi:Mn2+/Fe2+ NRAMP family transporter